MTGKNSTSEALRETPAPGGTGSLLGAPGTLVQPASGKPDVEDIFEDGIEPLPFPIAVIGASAGGAEAFAGVFDVLSPNAGIAYVVISSSTIPDGHLAEFLATRTQMPVVRIEEGARPEPDRVFLAPPAFLVELRDGAFQLVRREEKNTEPFLPIDTLLYSLADHQKNRAIGVVLSGSDADGALGLQAVKAEGGLTIVQQPETAQFPAMPRKSLIADHVDLVGSPAQIAAHLERFGSQFQNPVFKRLEQGDIPQTEDIAFARILNLLQRSSGIDFRQYRPATVRRRIARRMMLKRADTLNEYYRLLQSNAEEMQELQEDALIGVTRFFRDKEVFQALRDDIIGRLVLDREPQEQIRVWVAGCSTGEEVYSVAICLLEYFAGKQYEPAIQIFGTDASERSLATARAATYPESIAADVGPDRLRRFFANVEKGFQVSKRVRDLCIFSRQNICNDPPFSRIDLVSCRNVLIYLEAPVQRQIIVMFHYALQPGGCLLLGTSESIRDMEELFIAGDRKLKYYWRARGPSRSLYLPSSRSVTLTPSLTHDAFHPPVEDWTQLELQRAVDRILIARYAPPGVVINERLEIIQSRGHTGPYLELSPGTASLNLLRMVREPIAAYVREAVQRAIQGNVPVAVEAVIGDGASPHTFTLEVLPVRGFGARSACYLLLFAPGEPYAQELRAPQAPPGVVDGDGTDRTVFKVRQELASTKLYLQSLIEERDAKNHELVSANEEIQSANEELQSTNEELETTKEELQSANEELQTVNEELQQRADILTQTSNDLNNLLTSVNIPVLILSSELRVRHFTPPTQRWINVRPGDVGRPIQDIRTNLQIDDLEPLLTEVLETLATKEIEIQDREGRWQLLRVRPYRTLDNKIEGVVLLLIDIDQMRKSQQETELARDYYAQSILECVQVPMTVVDSEFKIRTANATFRSLAGFSGEELHRRSFPDLASELWGIEDLRVRLRKLLEQTERQTFTFEHVTPGMEQRILKVSGVTVHPDHEVVFLVTVEDLTAQRNSERVLREAKEKLESEVRITAQALNQSQDELRALTASLFESQEEERRRVARELHDDVVQRLGLLELHGQEIAQSIRAANPEMNGTFDNLLSTIRNLSDDVRNLSHKLHPSILDDLGIVAALTSLVDEFAEKEQMVATLHVQNLPEEIPRQVAGGLYRIAQEALRNVSKHAGKTHVKVFLEGDDHNVTLTVSDFGEGFDTTHPRAGLGLIAMQERARLAGGNLGVESELGRGTTIRVRAPWIARSTNDNRTD